MGAGGGGLPGNYVISTIYLQECKSYLIIDVRVKGKTDILCQSS